MNQYFTKEGGIVTYMEKEPVREYTGLSTQASFEGWQMPHVCVTAAYALTGSQAALDYLVNHQHPTGYWESYWWEAREYATALAVEAMCKKDPVKYRPNITAATVWALEETGKTLDASPAEYFKIALLLRILLVSGDARNHKTLVERIVEQLLNAQQAQGCWNPSSELRVPMPGNTNPTNKDNTWVVKDVQKNFGTITILNTLHKYLNFTT